MKTIITALAFTLTTVFTIAQTPSQVEYYDNGKVKAEYFAQADGMIDAKFYYSSGQLREVGQFKDLKRHGAWTSYSRSGDVSAKGTFVEGAKAGVWMFWDFNGDLSHEVSYEGEKPQLVVHNQEK